MAFLSIIHYSKYKLKNKSLQAFEPAFSKVRRVIERIKSEEIQQKDIKTMFGSSVPGYSSYEDVRRDLLHICHAVSDLYPERISDRTFKKLEIILSDLKSAFECLDSIKRTLNITSPWEDVERLRKTVSNQYLASLVSLELSVASYYVPSIVSRVVSDDD